MKIHPDRRGARGIGGGFKTKQITNFFISKKINNNISFVVVDLKILNDFNVFRPPQRIDFQLVTRRNAYAIRIYELLKQYETIGERTLEFDEMKRMFELEKE